MVAHNCAHCDYCTNRNSNLKRHVLLKHKEIANISEYDNDTELKKNMFNMTLIWMLKTYPNIEKLMM